ncbi:hypothetical protein, partial [Neptuniibacter sp. UBA6509]
MNNVNFQEEFSSKIPALTLLSNLGYDFIPPAECELLRGNQLSKSGKSSSQVILQSVMRSFLARQHFSFASKSHLLSEDAIDKV